MNQTYAHQLRLVVAATLLSVWAYSHLARTPVIGDTSLPLVVAIFLKPRVSRAIRNPSRRALATACLLIAFIVALVLLVPDRIWGAALHSPWTIVPLWLLGLVGLAKPMSEVEPMQADTQSPHLPIVER